MFIIFAPTRNKTRCSTMRETEREAYSRLEQCGLRPSVQRMVIMEYLLTHKVHPTVEYVYKGVKRKLPTISRTTVYNTLRLFADMKAAQMLTIDEHRVCYDGTTQPHVHFLCKSCGKIIDLMDIEAPALSEPQMVDGNKVDEAQLYYKGICEACSAQADKE